MSKIFSKSLKKVTLMSVVLAIVLAAAIVVCSLLGFNKAASLDDAKTLTVSMNKFAYDSNKEAVIDGCEAAFGKTDAKYVIEGEMSGDECQIIFVFDKDVNAEALKTAAAAYIDDKMATDATWDGMSISVSVATEKVQATLAKHFVLRAAIASVVMAVLAFGYVAIRHQKVSVGLVVGASVLLGMLLPTALLILTRVPVTTTVAAIVAVCGLLTMVSTMLTVGKIRATQKENAQLSNEELVETSLPVKETLFLAGAIAVGMILVGALGKTEALWFAVASLIGILSATAISLFFMPAMYWSVKTFVDAKFNKAKYVGAKKTSTKQKKARIAKKAPMEAEVAPVEESVAEVAEETPVVSEDEPVAEVVEETPVVEENAAVEETEEA